SGGGRVECRTDLSWLAEFGRTGLVREDDVSAEEHLQRLHCPLRGRVPSYLVSLTQFIPSLRALTSRTQNIAPHYRSRAGSRRCFECARQPPCVPALADDR